MESHGERTLESHGELSEIVAQDPSRRSSSTTHDHLTTCTQKKNPSATHKFAKDLFLAYKTLGVVFGGLVTSPLYVYPSMQLKSPTEDDYLGIYSIMFWTLTLIGVVKYCFIALRADDKGEGGTFAMYSLLCRHANISIFPRKQMVSSSSLQTRKKSMLILFFEQSLAAKRVLLFLAMLAMCMLIGDGIVTPAISVLSAMNGLRGPFHFISGSLVKALSSIVLIAMFLLQKFGTSRVSFLFSPIMGAWTITTPIIGIYSTISHYPSIFKALSPHYIFHFFIRNGKEGWFLLGGTVMCITGIEALFADLGHFNRRSIQTTFMLTIYPSLVLTYAGQTAYLIKHPDDHDDGFYKFVPDAVYWPMFILSTLAATVASQSLISATFSIIKQSVMLDYFPRVKVVHTSPDNEGEVYSPEVNYTLMVLCVTAVLILGDGKDLGNAYGVVVSVVMLITTILLTLVMLMIWRTQPVLAAIYFITFAIIEGVYISAVFTKIPEGGWSPLAISLILVFIMFGWFYGRQRKLEYEMTNKITSQNLKNLLLNPEIQWVPGMCFFYSNIQDGLTPVLGHYIVNTKSWHEVTVFTTFRCLMVAKVPEHERVVVKKLGLKGVYGCVIQYGYADTLNSEGEGFVRQVMDSLETHIQKSAELSSVSPLLVKDELLEYGDTDTHIPEGDCFVSQVINNMETHTLNNADLSGVPLLSVEDELLELEHAKKAGVVHVKGKTRFHLGKEIGCFDKVMLAFYEVLHRNCRSSLPALGIPLAQRIEVGMLYEA